MRRKAASLLMISLLVTSLSACGSTTSGSVSSGSETSTGSSSNSSIESQPVENDASATSDETSDSITTIIRGGNLTLRRTGVTPINPTQTIAPEGDSMTYLLFFETLTWNNEKDFSPQPWLGESWEWSDDNLALTMKIKQGVKFFDGSTLDANAVKSTFEFYMDPDTADTQASLIENLKSVDVLDDYTVQFNFSEPDSGFLSALSQPVGIILSPSSIEHFRESGDPEVFAREGGCGPFILDTFKDGESLTAKKNPNYYQMGEDGQTLPYLDSVTVQIIGDESVMDANMNSGDIDVVDFFYDQNYIDDLKANSNVTVYPIATNTQYILYLNMAKAPFDDISVRQAMCYAVDRQDLIDTICEGDGYMTPSIVLPTQSFYREGIIYDYEPEKSQQILSDAGYPDGVDVDFYYGTYGQNQEIAELIQSQAEPAGFHINLMPTDGATVKQLWASYNKDTPGGMRMNELGHPKATPYIQMDYTFGQNALQNSAKWFDDDLAKLLSEIRTTTDEKARDQVLIKIQEMAEKDIPIVSLYTTYKYSAYQNWVEGLKYNGGGTMIFTDVWMNK